MTEQTTQPFTRGLATVGSQHTSASCLDARAARPLSASFLPPGAQSRSGETWRQVGLMLKAPRVFGEHWGDSGAWAELFLPTLSLPPCAFSLE